MGNNSISNGPIQDQVLSQMDKPELLATIKSLSAAYEKSTTLLGQHQVDASYKSNLLEEQTAQWEEMYELLRLRQYEVDTYRNVIECQLLFQGNSAIVLNDLQSKIMSRYYESQKAGTHVDMEGLPEDWNG